jgi:hypothetical protein
MSGWTGETLPAIHPPPAHGVLIVQTTEVFMCEEDCLRFPRAEDIYVTLIAQRGLEPHSPCLMGD